MLTGVLVTNGGPHSAEDWALSTAEHICRVIKIAEDSPNRGKLELERKKAEAAISEIMLVHHAKAQSKDSSAPNFEAITDQVVEALQPLLVASSSQRLIPGFLGNPVPSEFEFNAHLRLGVRQKIEMDINTIFEIESAYSGA